MYSDKNNKQEQQQRYMFFKHLLYVRLPDPAAYSREPYRVVPVAPLSFTK